MRSLLYHKPKLPLPGFRAKNIPMIFLLLWVFILYAPSLFSQNNNELHERYYSQIEQKIKIFGIEEKDKVCDFGTGTSNTMYLMACFIDSLEIYLQDIDSAILSDEIIEENISTYSIASNNINKSKFNFVIGEEKKTNLPINYFDKIIMVKVLHHIPDENKEIILRTLNGNLNENGILILGDMLKSSSKRECQGNRLLTENEIKELLRDSGFKTIKTHIEKTDRTDLKYFIAEKNIP